MVKDIDSLEKVQRRATKSKLVTSLAKLMYEQRQKHLRLHSLYCRRQRKIEMRQPGRTRGHTLNIFKPSARLLTRQRFFSIRVIDQWL